MKWSWRLSEGTGLDLGGYGKSRTQIRRWASYGATWMDRRRSARVSKPGWMAKCWRDIMASCNSAFAAFRTRFTSSRSTGSSFDAGARSDDIGNKH